MVAGFSALRAAVGAPSGVAFVDFPMDHVFSMSDSLSNNDGRPGALRDMPAAPTPDGAAMNKVWVSSWDHALGDPEFGRECAERNTPLLPAAPPRLFLHAAHLAFRHPVSGEWLTFQSGLPGEMARYMAELREAAKD